MDILLFTHIVGAMALFGLGAWALADVWTGRTAVLKTRALQIGGLFLLQVASGSALALADQAPSVVAYCSKMGLYLGTVAVIESVLLGALTRTSFPLVPVTVIAGLSLFVIGGTTMAL